VQGLPIFFQQGIAQDMLLMRKPKNSAKCRGQVAEEQDTVGQNIAHLIKGETMGTISIRHWGYVVPLKGYFAVAD